MNPQMIPNYTRVLNKPDNWDESQLGECGALAVADCQDPDTKLHYMVSAWKPTESELAALNEGGSVLLYVYGGVHPTVWVAASTPL
jgi:hypothetical protein